MQTYTLHSIVTAAATAAAAGVGCDAPSVPSMAMQRTLLSPMCCATSSTRRMLWSCTSCSFVQQQQQQQQQQYTTAS
jgi:hypothetical protein